MSKILGISVCFHDTAIACIEDGQIKGLFEEEKLTGVKSVYQKNIDPDQGLRCLKDVCGLELKDFDYICFASSHKKSFASRISNEIENNKVSVHSHHDCHALGSYFTSGFDGKVISLSHDGKGNHSRGKIYLCENGSFEQVHSQKIATTASLAGIWAASTFYLGWEMLKDEGKVVGLAAHGEIDENIYKLMNQCFHYEDFNFLPGEWENLWHYTFNIANPNSFSDNTYRQNYAATLQKFTEDMMFSYLKDIHEKYPDYRKLCLSGGLFANVKLNKFINELNFFDEIFVHPAMGDSGLALGAAICKANELGEIVVPDKLKNTFYGENFSRSDWEQKLLQKQDELNILPFDLNKIAELIHDGNVIGLFLGKTEYGPRALGGRSILVRPTDPDTHAKLNERLNRTEIMPFAPSVMEDYLNKVFIAEKSQYASEFMTLCYDTRDEWINKIPAVVHQEDKSSRPQSVNKENNSLYYEIIRAYYNVSGIPLVLNTSLNAHGEPINNYPHQVLKHLFDGIIDFIVTEDYIISKL
jgi:carbamoyltransferase